jgi:hypothetical protein
MSPNRNRYARLFHPDPGPSANPAPPSGLFPGLRPGDDAIEPAPGWLGLADARIRNAIASGFGTPELVDSGITLARLVRLAELDDPPAMEIVVDGGSILARWSGPGGDLLATVRGRMVVMSAWHCMQARPSAFFPRDAYGEVVLTRTVSDAVGQLRAGLEWATGRQGWDRVQVVRDAGARKIAI